MKSASAEPSGRKARDAARRQADILAAAEELFASRGFHLTSMEDVAARAEYATGTIYRYFKNKEDLYLELLRRKLAEYLAALRRAAAADAPPAERLRALIRCKARFFHENAAFLGIYITELDARPGPRLGLCVPGPCEGLYREIVGILRGVLREGMEAGEFAEMNADLAASAINGLTNQALLDAGRGGFDPAEAEAVILRFVEGGLLAGRRPAGGAGRNGRAGAAGRKTRG